jgi:hypothetical protein
VLSKIRRREINFVATVDTLRQGGGGTYHPRQADQPARQLLRARGPRSAAIEPVQQLVFSPVFFMG